MQNYSVTPMFVDHVDEIVEDIKLQYEKGISVCPLFYAKIHPEGIPATNKTDKICKDFMVFKERLDKLGLPAGFLLQSTIGHGYQLDDAMPYTPFTSMTDGKEDTAYCPLDEDFRKYIKNAVKELAKCHPAVIMIDDDVTVLHWKPGIGGCGCDNHIADFNRRAGTNMTRAELYDYIMSHPAYDPITLKFVESQREALLGAVKAMREGIDEVDPTIQGLISTTGDICEFAKVLAPAFAGKGNPTIVRIGNGSYAPASSLCFSDMLYRTASRYKCLEDSIDMIISEGDTIPWNHYGRDSSFYHSQMTLYSLQGCVGSKLWITNLVNHSPKYDKRFRDVLGGNMPLITSLSAYQKTLSG